ncbi:MAG: helix-turn-helix domain-containing protein [Proteobacteria bacterium]|nr:helix-turn-helix domain-containing protein [Pseudomonadota bacterium]
MKKAIYSKESKLLCQWLTTKRHEKQLTQRQFACLLGVHHSIVGKIETGERQINVIELIEYCATLYANPIEIIEVLINTKK